MSTRLIVTVGGRFSNSYQTLEEAEARIVSLGLPTTGWTTDTSTDGLKELKLMIAAQLMKSFPYRGEQAYEYQALSFPRDIQADKTKIPEEALDVQVMFAIDAAARIMETSEDAPSATILDQALVKSVEVMGVLKVGLQTTIDSTTRNSIIQRTNAISKAVTTYGSMQWLLLAPYLTQVRGDVVRSIAEERRITESLGRTKLPSPDYTPTTEELYADRWGASQGYFE